MRSVAWISPLVDIYPQYRSLAQLVVSAHQSRETREKWGWSDTPECFRSGTLAWFRLKWQLNYAWVKMPLRGSLLPTSFALSFLKKALPLMGLCLLAARPSVCDALSPPLLCASHAPGHASHNNRFSKLYRRDTQSLPGGSDNLTEEIDTKPKPWLRRREEAMRGRYREDLT